MGIPYDQWDKIPPFTQKDSEGSVRIGYWAMVGFIEREGKEMEKIMQEQGIGKSKAEVVYRSPVP